MPHTRVRKEFGLARGSCSCRGCVLNCRVMPGYLVPSDLGRLIPAGADPLAWAEEHLRASPGALVERVGPGGERERFRVPTLVPAHRADLSCHWLDPETERCAVHADAPFGCAFFSCRDDIPRANEKSRPRIEAVYAAWRGRELYADLWIHLSERGLAAASPESKRTEMGRRISAGALAPAAEGGS